MTDHLTVLIIGGYGTFGGRLAELLVDDSRLTLIIAGRSRDKAEAFCKTLSGTATLVAASFDRDAGVDTQIASIKPNIVVDATGPFQAYGDDPYSVVKACLRAGISYLDLADGSDFVKAFRNSITKQRRETFFVLAGVSSFPVLTSAVVRHLSRDMTSIDTVKSGIAPSPYAGVGLNVIRAIASYAGQRIDMIRDGSPRSVTG